MMVLGKYLMAGYLDPSGDKSIVDALIVRRDLKEQLWCKTRKSENDWPPNPKSLEQL